MSFIGGFTVYLCQCYGQRNEIGVVVGGIINLSLVVGRGVGGKEGGREGEREGEGGGGRKGVGRERKGGGERVREREGGEGGLAVYIVNIG